MIKKIMILSIVSALFAHCNVCGQSNAIDIYKANRKAYVDDWLTLSTSLGKFINYTDSTAHFSKFKDKLLVIGFWFTSCTSCVDQFPKEDSLQKLFGKDMQLVLATFEPKEQVAKFIAQWESKNNRRFNLPIIVEDTILRKIFNVYYNPTYTWIMPGGKYMAQTSEHMISASVIRDLLPDVEYYRQWMYRGDILKRLNDINTLPDEDKVRILYTLDELIKSAKQHAL